MVQTPIFDLLQRLIQFVPDAGVAQVHAWKQELNILQSEGAEVLRFEPRASAHQAVLEYQMPREGGRRPDVLVLQNGRVAVLEFKESGIIRRADLDQVSAYARDLSHYHTGFDGLIVTPVLVLAGAIGLDQCIESVRVISADRLGRCLLEFAQDVRGPQVTASQVLEGEYAPLPTLVAAARLLFENLELPAIKRARSAGVHDAVARVLELAREARISQQRLLVLLTGVPGAGKTLVGLQVVHSTALEEGYRFGARNRRGAPATFLSGNGPLVQVLQNALHSTAFVRDMHAYIREYGLERPDLVPNEHVIVFDEAQRAWDAPKINDFYMDKLPHLAEGLDRSEPDLLISAAARLPGWSVVLALVGQGQEIHTGEEGGMEQWVEAIARQSGWMVHGPAQFAPIFAGQGVPFYKESGLDLDTSLRFHAATDLHGWVESLIDHNDLNCAAERAHALRHKGFPIYVTRDLEAAKSYIRDRFAGEPMRRYGLIASSKARNLVAHGVDPTFQATKKLQIGKWFNTGMEDVRSCTRFEEVATEFQCQGLELDFSLVCWGNDLIFHDEQGRWITRPERRSALRKNPDQLRRNAYRVLLTRGREGMIFWVPPDASLDQSFAALVAAGAIVAGATRAVLAA